MNRRINNLIITCIAAVLCLTGVSDAEEESLPFRKNEKFVYDVMYKIARIGRSVLTFKGERELNGEKVYYITFDTKVPSMKDSEELYADTETFLPVEVHRKINKTLGFDEKIIEKYDQREHKVTLIQKSSLRDKESSIEKDSEIHNAILLVYYYRMKEGFDKNDKYQITLPTINFEVTYEGIETIETPLGEHKAHAFTSNPEKFKLWLSTDEKRLPLKIGNPSVIGYSLVLRQIE